MPKRILLVLLALALAASLCACQRGTAQPDPIRDPAQPADEASASNDLPAAETEEPQPTDGPPAETTEVQPPEDPTEDLEEWEEDWPEEYPVEQYILQPDAIIQSGALNEYRYDQQPGAEDYPERLADYVRQKLGCGDALTLQQDSAHDGYANWFMEAPNGSASVSGSSITGRFSFQFRPEFAAVEPLIGAALEDREGLEQAARDFAAQFSDLTGPLVLLRSAETESWFTEIRGDDWRDVKIPALRFTFCAEENAQPQLLLQPGLSVPVTCGDSDIEDLSVHCFVITVLPDGTVTGADNYITRAEAHLVGTTPMLTQQDLPTLLRYLTSLAPGDTVVFRSLRADRYSVYFGHAEIEPTLTVEYYFESDPGKLQSTQFVMPGLFG